MNYIISMLILLMVLPTQIFGMYTTFFKPTFWHEKPRLDRMNMTSYELTYSYVWATKSFDKNGKKVPLLAFSNPEPLLPCFLNTKDSCQENTDICKDNKPIAYAIFDGKFSETVVSNDIIQNLHKHFFIQVNIPITNSYLKNISITPTDKCGNTIDPTQEINSYIDKLSLKIFETSSKNEQGASVLGPSFLLFGFMKSFNNFKHIDILDFEFKTGLVVPVIGLNCDEKLNIFPRTELSNFGIPFQLKCMIGAYDWLNFGVAATLVAHIPRDGIYDINQNPYPNKLIIPTRQMAQMFHYPFVACTTYFEGENFLPHWSWYIGFNFVKQYKTTWNICGATPAENQLAQDFPALVPWHQGALTLSSEIDFSKDERKIMPRIKFIYVKRLFGKNCFDTALFAGQYGFEILYDF